MKSPSESETNGRKWSLEAAQEIYSQPFPDLLYQAQTVHREYHDPMAVQMCSLLSIKTGGCPEDCSYCPQSAHYSTPVDKDDLADVDDVLSAAVKAREGGATRFCMGAAWREARDGNEFDSVLEMVRGVRALGMEACCTLGMLSDEQAERLGEAGLTSYNHNLDTGPAYYDQIVTTRSYQDRLDTLSRVQRAGISVCSGGILGMGETIEDRLEMLCDLANMNPQPGSVPINSLVPSPGTPLEHRAPVSGIEMARSIATARILMPKSRVRLSAGRLEMSDEAQALCFLAGANSIFCGDKLLTTPNPAKDSDHRLLEELGMRPAPADEPEPVQDAEISAGR